MSIVAHNQFKDEDVEVPEHIVERTEALLSAHPPTNQRVVLDTAQWWLTNVGNCAIYCWAIHHLDTLEHDNVVERATVYTDARDQAREIGII